MSCDEALGELKADIDGELGFFLRRRLEHHLAGCPACRAEREALVRLSDALSERETPALPLALRSRLVALAPKPTVAPGRRRAPLVLASGALGMAALACVSLFFLRPNTALESATSAPAASGAASPELSKSDTQSLRQNSAKMADSSASELGAAPATESSRVERKPALRQNDQEPFAAPILILKAATRNELIEAARAVSARVVHEDPLLLEGTEEMLKRLQARLRPEPEIRRGRAAQNSAMRFSATFRVVPAARLDQ